MLHFLSLFSVLFTFAPQGPQVFPNNFIDGLSIREIAAGDLNHDGVDDLVLLNYGGTYEVRLNTGNGGFLPSVLYKSTSPELDISYVLLVDINHDAHLDCLVKGSTPGPNPTSILCVRLGNGTGALGSLASFDMGWGSTLQSGDLNGDGNPDVAQIRNISGLYHFSIRFGDGTGSFGPLVSFPAVTNPGNTIIADFNVDGVMDIATTGADVTLTNGFAAFFYGTGGGNFAPPATLPMGSWVAPCAAADVNEDGMADFVANYHSNNAVLLRTSQGGGNFGSIINIPAVSPSSRFLVADVNRDQHIDIIHFASASTKLRLGNGDTTFGAQYSTLGAYATYGGTLAEINGDGIPDIVEFGFGTQSTIDQALTILAGDGFGSFGCITVFGGFERAIALADLNHDGNLDVVTAQFSNNSINIRLANNILGFTTSSIVSVGMGPIIVKLGDFNRDGKLDAVTFNSNSHDITILRGDGAGGFVVTETILLGYDTFGLQIVDVNDDDLVDLVVGNTSNGGISVHLGDGIGGFRIPKHYPFASFQYIRIYPGDVNLDGNIDFAASHFQGAWLRYNNGSGGFAAGVKITTTSSDGTWIGDANGDGAPDYLINPGAGLEDINLYVRFNNGTGGASGPLVQVNSMNANDHGALVDVTGDGLADLIGIGLQLNVRPGQQGLAGFGAPQISALYSLQDFTFGDLNHDGRLDLALVGSQQTSLLLNQIGVPSGIYQYGSGTPGCMGIQGLTASGPATIGNNNFSLDCTGGPQSGLGICIITTGADFAGTPLPALGTILQIDLFGSPIFASFDIETNHLGYCSAPAPIPNDPQLSGQNVFAQAFFVWPECPFSPPRSLSSSAGLSITFQ